MPDAHALLIDVGNNSTKAALVSAAGRLSRRTRVKGADADKETIRRTVANYAENGPIDGAIISSVVPDLTDSWGAAVKQITKLSPLIVTNRISLPLKIRYSKPFSIGGDRLADACGAMERFGPGVIILDFGTALTFDLVTPKREYVGGVIAPGLDLMTDYMAERTALLPKVKLTNADATYGKTTVEAMRIGTKVGFRGMVREILGHLVTRLGWTNPKICATGRKAEWVLDHLGMPIVFDPDLTLHGLHVIYKHNKEG